VISDASNLFFGEVLLGVEDILQPENYGLIVCNTDEILERESHYLDLLLSQRVEGLIAAATSQRWTALAQAKIQHTPIVSVDRTFEGSEVPFVGVNNKHGAYLGTKHLIECGHHKLGIIAGFDRLSTMRERLAGFRQALEEYKIPLPEEWIVYSPLKAGREVTHQILAWAERPTALFINNNQLTVGVLLALKEVGLSCPEDISLVAFDDHPWAAVSDPPLTVVRQPTRELGQISARMLHELIRGQPLAETRIILECELVIRQSSCPPR
jgi:DNA-binding LacI/PurR family transcriptional regulator